MGCLGWLLWSAPGFLVLLVGLGLWLRPGAGRGDRIGEGALLMSSAGSSAPSWQGVSAQAFSAAVSSLSGELSGRAGELGRGAGVMDAYAGVLERAHGMAAELQAQAARLLVTS
ncbi:hypothetical protein BKH26_12765, partial [Actinomyces oris]